MAGVCLVCRSDGWRLQRHRVELLSSGLERPVRTWIWLCPSCVGRWVGGEPLAQIDPAHQVLPSKPARLPEPELITAKVRAPRRPRQIRVRPDAAEAGPVAGTVTPVTLATATPGAWGAISPREREVAALVARGYANAEIAQQLVVEPGTVANHVASILRKLGLRSRVEIAIWAIRTGLTGAPGGSHARVQDGALLDGAASADGA